VDQCKPLFTGVTPRTKTMSTPNPLAVAGTPGGTPAHGTPGRGLHLSTSQLNLCRCVE
jgi:hypothetical protein